MIKKTFAIGLLLAVDGGRTECYPGMRVYGELGKVMDITEKLTIGQAFSIDNPPYEVFSEVWKVVRLSYPDVTFSYTKYWVRDIAYTHISTTDTVAGVAIEETDKGVIIELKNFPYLEVGLLIKGDRGRYLIDELSV